MSIFKNKNRDKSVLFRLIGYACGGIVVLLMGVVFGTSKTAAASLAQFDPGYIISDYQMGNYNSMSEAEIQAFLTAKNSCPNRDAQYYQRISAGSVATWHFENGHFVCLSEERFGDGEVIGSGDTAAHIIWQTAQDYRINPQVILVLLQKETSLITDPIPNNYDYRKATGFGCPDTAACSSKYYGFKNQVRNAAALFRTVLDGGWTNYPLGDNYIQYNPNAGCGGSVVNIRSLATSALYRYTPYQPNAGAIAAGYGTATCGAYGNRNFYLYFQDWFGGITDYRETYELTHDNISDEVKNAILERYEANFALLGEPVAKINCNIGREGACVKSYKNGVIIYSPKTGAWENYGEIRRRYAEIGSVDGVLGYPNGPMNCDIGHTGACVQSYEKGVIIYGTDTGAWENYGAVRDKYVGSGSVDGSLGFPVSKMNCEIGRSQACVQAYQNGVIIYSPETGAWINQGEIRTAFVKNGSVDGWLGCPIADETSEEGVISQEFERGTIRKETNGNINVVNTAIEKRYADIKSQMGVAVAPLNCNIGHQNACVQAYQNGVIIYSPETGAWENYGAIRTRFVQLGSVDGTLGFPNGPMNCAIGHAGACVQSYQNGAIIYSSATGAWENYGEVRTRYVKLGSVDGVLGFPVGPMNCAIGHAGACVQAYQNGVIIYSPKTGAWESYGTVRVNHVKAGSVDGRYGFPTGPVVNNNGTLTQSFEGGRL